MSGQQHAPAALYPWERPGTHFTGGFIVQVVPEKEHWHVTPSCCQNQPHPHDFTAQPPEKQPTDIGTGRSVHTSSSLLNDMQKIVTELRF